MTHAERVAASRVFPPPSVEDILSQTRRLLQADLADGGIGWSIERGIGGNGARMSVIDAVNRALTNLRDGWLERVGAFDERCEAIDAIARAAGIEADAVDREIVVWAWSLDAGRTEVLVAVDAALAASIDIMQVAIARRCA